MSEIKIEWFSGTGSGGQHRNKHMNCCRVRHPSGLSAVGQSHRSRRANLRDAMASLAKRLYEHLNKKSDIRSERSYDRIRTYHVERSVMIDHASMLKISCNPIDDISAFSACIDARRSVLLSDKNTGT